MPIQYKATMLEMTAIAAAQALAIRLLDITDHLELSVDELGVATPDQYGIRRLDVHLSSGYTIAVKLSKRHCKNPEKDERWYAVSGWVAGKGSTGGASFAYHRQQNVSYYNPPMLAEVEETSVPKAQRKKVVTLRTRKNKGRTIEPTIEELLDD